MITALLLATCTVTDGDTIRCGAERIRIAGIDAPELPGHCTRNRVCTPGDGEASKRALEQLLAQGPLTIERVGTDRYRRTLAKLYVGGRNIACELMAGGWAVRRYEARFTAECFR